MNVVCMHVKLLQSYLILCNPMDYRPPGSSVHEIFQARILEWVAISSLQELFLTQGSNLRLVFSALVGEFFTAAPPGNLKA